MTTQSLYVGNLPYSVTEDDVLDHFAAYKAVNVRMVPDRGFAFVEIDAELVEVAILEKHDSELGGRRLTVKLATPKGDSRGSEQEPSGRRHDFRRRRHDG